MDRTDTTADNQIALPYPHGDHGGLPKVKPAGVYSDVRPFLDTTTRVTIHFSKSATMVDLEKDGFVFFSMGIVFSRIPGLPFDLWSQFTAETGITLDKLDLRFDKPIFSGMQIGDDAAWNHVVFVMPREQWEPFLSWLRSLSFVDSATAVSVVRTITYQRVTIPDFLVYARTGDVNPAITGTLHVPAVEYAKHAYGLRTDRFPLPVTRVPVPDGPRQADYDLLFSPIRG